MVYLIHFEIPYKHAQHYIGFVEDSLLERLEKHGKGKGARLLEVVKGAGIPFRLARVWELGDRTFERKLKRRKGAARFCPLCDAERVIRISGKGPYVVKGVEGDNDGS